jgi:Domain of unknown function (DUF4129)
MALLPPSDAAARAALEATFHGHMYDRTLAQTLWSRILDWIGEKLGALFVNAREVPALGWSIVATVAAIVLVLVARTAYLAVQRREAMGLTTRRAAGAAADDPWRIAAALAADGDFTAAAHALYAALLARLALRERIARHPAKTAGDYARELRALGSRAHAPFRQFARDYDRVVYGAGTCDAAQYGRLLDAANRVLPLATGNGRG